MTMEMTTTRLSVSDIKEMNVGARIRSTFLVRASADYETKAGSPYVAMTLGDKTGTIEARAWQVSGAPTVGSAIQVGAKITTYRDEVQLTVDAWTILDEGDEAAVDLVPSAPTSGGELLESVLTAVNEHCEGVLGDVVRAAIEMTSEKLKVWPAAQGHHHARLSGLVQHINSMIGIAAALHEHYRPSYDYTIDLGLVIAAIVFHDLGKVYELSGPIGTEYTDAGRLLGHITIGAEILADANEDSGPLEEGRHIHLHHLILSHHGKKDWGSPVEPMTPEAVFLHQIDLMDSRMDKALTVAAEAPVEGGWVDAGYGQKLFVPRGGR